MQMRFLLTRIKENNHFMKKNIIRLPFVRQDYDL